MKLLLAILTILMLLFVMTLPGCYPIKKARAQHGKAVTSFPEIGADYCARTYPVQNNYIKGDSVVTFDTLYVGGDFIFDTITVNDTVRITKVIQLPGKLITKFIRVTDTVKVVDKAALDLCSIERGKAIFLLDEKTKESDKWKKIAIKRLWVIIGLGVVLGLGIFFTVRKKLKP